MSIFEAIMLICFGAAWPVSIVKSYKSKSNSGKSLFFLVIVLIGYLSGIINKLLNNYDSITILYIINFIMVSIDMMLYFRNRKIKEICWEES
jgi:hypothetical protein